MKKIEKKKSLEVTLDPFLSIDILQGKEIRSFLENIKKVIVFVKTNPTGDENDIIFNIVNL